MATGSVGKLHIINYKLQNSMDNMNFPFEMRESKLVPGYRSLAIKEGKVTWLGPIETKVSKRTGVPFKMASINVQICVPEITTGMFLNCILIGADAEMLEKGLLKIGDVITSLIAFDIHGYEKKSYQDVNIREIEILRHEELNA